MSGQSLDFSPVVSDLHFSERLQKLEEAVEKAIEEVRSSPLSSQRDGSVGYEPPAPREHFAFIKTSSRSAKDAVILQPSLFGLSSFLFFFLTIIVPSLSDPESD